MTYSVLAKCGHTNLTFGRRFFIPINFAVEAENAKAAANIVRFFPRVKHQDSHAILSVQTIDLKEFKEIRLKNSFDEFLLANSSQDQKRRIPYEILQSRMQEDPTFMIAAHLTKNSEETAELECKHFFIGKLKIRNPRKYYKYSEIANFSEVQLKEQVVEI